MTRGTPKNLATVSEADGATLRPIDLARAAGISPSLVRLYEAEGFIPPANRTTTGHRRYTPNHQRSLLVARALRTGYGWKLARTTMQAVHRGDLDTALEITNQRHAQLHTETGRLTRALAAIDNTRPADPATASHPPRPLSIGAAAQKLQLTPATLRHWESTGVINPARQPNRRRRYSTADLKQLELVQVLRAAGYSFEAIAQLITSLKTNDRVQTRTALATRQAQLRRQTRAAAAATSDLFQLINTIE